MERRKTMNRKERRAGPPAARSRFKMMNEFDRLDPWVEVEIRHGELQQSYSDAQAAWNELVNKTRLINNETRKVKVCLEDLVDSINLYSKAVTNLMDETIDLKNNWQDKMETRVLDFAALAVKAEQALGSHMPVALKIEIQEFSRQLEFDLSDAEGPQDDGKGKWKVIEVHRYEGRDED
jgi:hypothetical protein